jgi:hypothetical protein
MFLRIYYILAWFSILMGTALILLVTFWMNYPYTPIVFQDKEFPIGNTIVKRGEMLFYTANYCKKNNLPAKVTRSYMNSIIYVTPTTITNRPSGCNSLIIGTIVPSELPPGKYFLEMSYQYQVNPIRKVTVIQNTEEFEVIP